MEKTIITSGKTIDLAIEAALTQLGLDRDSVSVTVLQQAKAGFLGFGAQPAKVQVAYEAPDPVPEKVEKPKSALGSASRSKPKAKPVAEKKAEPAKVEAPKAEKKAEAPKTEKKAEAPRAEKPKKERKPEQPKAEKKSEKKAEAPKEPKVYAPAEEGSTEQKIEVFIKGLLEHMGSKAIPHAFKGKRQHLLR